MIAQEKQTRQAQRPIKHPRLVTKHCHVFEIGRPLRPISVMQEQAYTSVSQHVH